MRVEAHKEHRPRTHGVEPLLQVGEGESPVHIFLEQLFRPELILRTEPRRKLRTPRSGNECWRLVWLVVVTDPRNRPLLPASLLNPRLDLLQRLNMVGNRTQPLRRELILCIDNN